MAVSVTVGTIYPAGTRSPSRVSSPATLRRLDRKFEDLASDIESLSRRIDAIVQQLSTVAPQVTVNLTGYTGPIVVRDAAGTGTITLTVDNGQIVTVA